VPALRYLAPQCTPRVAIAVGSNLFLSLPRRPLLGVAVFRHRRHNRYRRRYPAVTDGVTHAVTDADVDTGVPPHLLGASSVLLLADLSTRVSRAVRFLNADEGSTLRASPKRCGPHVRDEFRVADGVNPG